MPKNILLLVCLLVSGWQGILCHAQNGISGRVTDRQTGEPIAGVFISFISGNSTISYCFTNADGEFRAEFKDRTPDSISASILGYAPYKSTIESHRLDIRLRAQAFTLKAASVSESVIEERGDTLSFAVSAFREKEDMTVGDILQRLPGIEMNESGGIIHNGLSINKFYIDGLDLMGNRYGIVTKNLTADAIARVEIYRKHQPIRALEGISMTDRSAVNIILKESAKNTWMLNGGIAAGMSADEDFIFNARAMVTRFAKGSQDLYMAKGNNIGENILNELREQSYFGKTGSFLVSTESMDEDFTSSLNPQRTQMNLPEEFWYDNLSGIASFNHLHELNSGAQLRVSTQFAAENYSESSVRTQIVDIGDGNPVYIDEHSALGDNKYFVNAAATYEKNLRERYQLNEFRISGQFVESISGSTGGNQDFDQRYRLPSFKAENDYRTILRTANDNSVDLTNTTSFVRNVHSADYTADGRSAFQCLAESTVSNQSRASWTFRAGGLSISTAALLDIEYYSRDARLQQELLTGRKTTENYGAFELAPGITASTSWSKGPNRFRFRLPLRLRIILPDGSRALVRPSLQPSVNYTLRISQNWEFLAGASFYRNYGGLESLGTAVILTNYRTYTSLPGLNGSSRISTNATLKYSNNPAMFYASVSGNWSMNSSEKTGSSTYSTEYSIIDYLEAPMQYRSYGVSGQMSKYFGVRTFVVNIKAGHNIYSQEQYLQGVLLPFSGSQTNVELSMRCSPARWISAEIESELTISRTEGGSAATQYRTASEGSVTVSPFAPMNITARAYHLWWDNKTTSANISNTPIISLRASWKFTKFNVFAECRNLLDCDELRIEQITPYTNTANTYRLRGLEFLAGVSMSM